MKWRDFLCISVLFVLNGAGCATVLPARSDDVSVGRAVVLGRVVTLLTGPTTRWYEPELRFMELMSRTTGQRYRINIRSYDKDFILDLPPGTYELTRVQISEGPFMSMADLNSTFDISQERLNYVGTWRFGVDSPGYNRMIALSAIEDEEDQEQAQRQIVTDHPELLERRLISVLPEPPSAQSRLYEVMPYPRYPRYFRRHWW